MISARGKKKRLRMKYPMKLCPLRPATRAGQNAINTQMMRADDPYAEPHDDLLPAACCLRSSIVAQHRGRVITEMDD